MSQAYFLSNYTPIGDVITLSLCCICIILQLSSYTIKSKGQIVNWLAFGGTLFASVASLSFYLVSNSNIEIARRIILLYILKDVKYISLALVLHVNCAYLTVICKMNERSQKSIARICGILYVVYIIIEVISPWTGFGLYIDMGGVMHQDYIIDTFTPIFLIYSIFITALIIFNRKRFITRMRQGLLMTMVMVYTIMLVQTFYEQTSFTCFALYLPTLVSMFMFHYNAYDLDTGTLNRKSFQAYVNEVEKRRPGFIYLELQEMSDEFSDLLKNDLYHFGEGKFARPMFFLIGENKFLLTYLKEINPNYKESIRILIEDFRKLYNNFRIDFKVVFFNNENNVKIDGEGIIHLFELMSARMGWKEFFEIGDKELDYFEKHEATLRAFQDMYNRQDLDDDRVIVYCQPVYDVNSCAYTTAEALMRMRLPDYGMLFPDFFIPIAERYEFIHTLTRIIMWKTCREIKRLVNEGYFLERVSVNVSCTELRIPNFSNEIIELIQRSGVEMDKIAIEITESRNDRDFENSKSIMEELQKYGIRFYLDDFGTGYSNMERLISLPFNIIKFDRSMTILSGKSEESKYLVRSQSDIFKNSGYSILFEGVEDDADEQRCVNMNAEYLQGYKYSKPVPIGDLRKFLRKNEEESRSE